MEKKQMLFILIVVLVITDAKPTGHHNHQCSDIRGGQCQQDDECVCPNHPTHSKMICNYRRKCHIESAIDRIMRRQPCFPYYKSWCMTDKDCPPCNEARFTCEENECVKMRLMTA